MSRKSNMLTCAAIALGGIRSLRAWAATREVAETKPVYDTDDGPEHRGRCASANGNQSRHIQSQCER